MASILLDGITVSFAEGPALRELNLHVPDGEFFVLLGPSGSGKTTVLRAIAGLEPVETGDVLFDGKAVTSVPTAQRNVAMVFQENVLYPNLEVRGNIGFPLWTRKLAREEIDQRVEAESRVLEIERLLDRKPSQLSAGHQQLVQAAKAMVLVPDVFLMDEPIARLDAALRTRVRREFKLLQQGYGVTTVYATNDQADAMAVATRLAVLDAGRVRQIAAPLDVYSQPTDVFVARFVGSPPMNLVPARVTDAPGGWTLRLGEESLPISSEAAPWADEEILLGFRAADVDLGGHRGLPVSVVDSELVGDRALVRCRLGGEEIVVRVDEQLPEPGSTLYLRPRRYHLFDVSDGKALLHVTP